jgi:hypothetical protein
MPKFIVCPAVSPLMFGVALMVPAIPAPRLTPFQGVPVALVTVVPLGTAGTLNELNWPALPAVSPRSKVVGIPALRFVAEKLIGFNVVPCTARIAEGAVIETSGAIGGTMSALACGTAPEITLTQTAMLMPSEDWEMTNFGFIFGFMVSGRVKRVNQTAYKENVGY